MAFNFIIISTSICSKHRSDIFTFLLTFDMFISIDAIYMLSYIKIPLFYSLYGGSFIIFIQTLKDNYFHYMPITNFREFTSLSITSLACSNLLNGIFYSDMLYRCNLYEILYQNSSHLVNLYGGSIIIFIQTLKNIKRSLYAHY